jgi:hypothetical protein
MKNRIVACTFSATFRIVVISSFARLKKVLKNSGRYYIVLDTLLERDITRITDTNAGKRN